MILITTTLPQNPFGSLTGQPSLRRRLSVQEVIELAASLGGVSPQTLRSRCRTKALSRIRWALARALSRARGLSTPQIGRLIGGRDHTTILHGLTRAAALYATDPEFAALCDQLERAAR